MPTVDPAAINTVLLAVFGVGGTFFIWKFVGPILKAQEQHRVTQGQEMVRLTDKVTAAETKVAAAEAKIALLEEMVTQRAQVDDLRQFVKLSVDESNTQHRLLLAQIDSSGREQSTQHQQMVLAMHEMVVTLRGIERHIGRDERSYGSRGERGAPGVQGETGERGEKGDHGQAAGT